MKNTIGLIASIAFIIFACTNSKNTNKFLQRPGEIKADQYTINTDADTTLQTKYGALLKIPKGSLTPDNGNTVVLEIREAYTMEQIVRSGLTTTSNGELLSSGGMIYINAAAGQDVKINQPIKVAIPASYLADSMQLFKGKINSEGSINWSDPSTLPENSQLTEIIKGKQLFETSCVNCHTLGREVTGPDLANILHRKYIDGEGGFPRMHSSYPYRNYPVDSSNDHFDRIYAYHCNVLNIYKSLGPLFPEVRNEKELAIYRYIQNESDKRSLALPSHIYLDECIDSCSKYYEWRASLQSRRNSLVEKKEVLEQENGPLVNEINKSPSPIIVEEISSPVSQSFEDMVSPKNYDASYYQFSIESFGWFNIDILLKGNNGVEESELFVRISGAFREKLQVYLIIPSVKVYVQGGPAARNEKEFAFQYKDGKIFLPQGVEAYVLAVSESEISIAFALKEFTTSLKQELNIELKSSTIEEFKKTIKIINTDELRISAGHTKNVPAIREISNDLKVLEKEIEKSGLLKPKNCNCDCGNGSPLPGTQIIQ